MEDSRDDPPGDVVEDTRIATAYRYILEAFPRLGREPTLVEMEKDLHLRKDVIVDILRSLDGKGALRLDPATSRIVDAYPYSALPTGHRVVFESGEQVHSMCAIDAFYIPFLTESDVAIYSRCFHCRADLEIRVERQKISTVMPATVVIWDSAASYDCPRTNFFCNEEHLRMWRDSVPEEPGQLCSLDAALDRGRKAASRIRQSVGA
jgi:hypothetical protein